MKLLAGAWRMLVHNFWWRLLALAIAVTIWAVVASEPESSTFTTVPIEYRNLPHDLEMSSAPVESVTLELRGPAGELSGLRESRSPSVVLDMSDITAGAHRFRVDGDNVRLARGVHLERAIPPEVRLEFEPRLERSIPVQVRFAGETPAHYQVNPDHLTVVGPARRVQSVGSAITDRVDVSSLRAGSALHVHAFVDDPYIRFQSSPDVTVTVTRRKN
jgi:YbbR domain-containing protein